MTDNRTHLDVRAMALLSVLCLSWGFQQIAVKVAIGDIPPLLQGGIRGIVATALLWIWLAARRQPLFVRDGTLLYGLAAGVLFSGEFILLYWGLAYTTASRAVLFLYLSPFVVAVGAHWLVPGERLHRLQVVGLLCAFSGVVAVFGEAALSPARATLHGDLVVLAGAVMWGATTVLIKASPLARIAPGRTLFYQLATSAVLMPAASALLEAWPSTLPRMGAVASLAYQAVWVAFVTYLAWFWLVRHYPAARLASFTFLTPLFGVKPWLF